MLEPTPTTKFKKDLKRFQYQQKVMKELDSVIQILAKGARLPEKNVDHPLGGNWKNSRECHVYPDILLIYRVEESQNKLFLERFGSHSELF